MEGSNNIGKEMVLEGSNDVIKKGDDDLIDVRTSESVQDQDSVRSRKKTSEVWNYFEEVVITNKDNTISHKVRCTACQRSWGKQKSGATTQLKRHMSTCLKLKKGKNKTIPFRPDGDSSTGLEYDPIELSNVYDQKKIREILAKTFIVHEYPFRMIEHKWFNILLKALNNNYQKVSRFTLRSDCLKLYDSEKEKLKILLKNVRRVWLTSDNWTSNQTIGYICITLHYVDDNWKLKNFVINFHELEPPHTGVNIADSISRCLQEWNILEKVQTITLDNASSNDVAAASLKNNLTSRNKLHFKGHIFHVRCAAHILNLLVQDGLKEISFAIDNVRETVKYLKKSSSRLYKFGQIARQLDVPTNKGLRLDVSTRWNSTYIMLDHAMPFKLVLKEYAARDANYEWLPSDEDWTKVEKVCKFLAIFNRVSQLFSGTKYSTANLYFVEIWQVKKMLDMHVVSDDEYMSKMAATMLQKFDKYWGECNLFMSLATVLDPRYKMQYLKFIFPKLYNSKDSEVYLNRVLRVLTELYDAYVCEDKMLSKEAMIDDNVVSLLPNDEAIDMDFEEFCEVSGSSDNNKSELENDMQVVIPAVIDS